MTVREQLRQIRFFDQELVALYDSVLEQETKLARVSPVISDMPRGCGSNDKMADGIAKLIELKQEINRRIDKVCDLKMEAIGYITEIDESIYRTILIERYINHKCFEEIALKVGYSYHRTVEKHGYALQAYTRAKTARHGNY